MTKEIPELERFTKTYPNLELGSLVMRYGSRELTGTMRRNAIASIESSAMLIWPQLKIVIF